MILYFSHWNVSLVGPVLVPPKNLCNQEKEWASVRGVKMRYKRWWWIYIKVIFDNLRRDLQRPLQSYQLAECSPVLVRHLRPCLFARSAAVSVVPLFPPHPTIIKPMRGTMRLVRIINSVCFGVTCIGWTELVLFWGNMMIRYSRCYVSFDLRQKLTFSS